MAKTGNILFQRITAVVRSRRAVRGRAILFLCAVGLIWGGSANAATFGFSSAEQTHAAGEVFTVTVFVSSPDQAVNAVSGAISVPAVLDVVSLSPSAAVVGFWVQPPVFSKAGGTISFEGVVLNPGYQGGYGSLFQVQLRANNQGTSALRFQSGAILAHDGQGTNVLEQTTSMSVVIGTNAAEVDEEGEGEGENASPGDEGITSEDTEQPNADNAEEEPQVPTAPPLAPRIQSPTHPESDTWYRSASPLFTWSTPRGITAARVGISHGATDAPTELRRGAIGSYQPANLADGVWTAHIQLQNALGWSPVSHRTIHIDTTPPTGISVQEIMRNDLSDPDVQFRLSAEDTRSGVDRFAVRVDDAEEYAWVDTETDILTLSDIKPGTHGLTIRALDKAGNATSTSVVFFVDALEAPVLDSVPSQLNTGDPLTVSGRTRYATSQVVLWLERDGQEAMSFLTASNADGAFSFTIRDQIPPGQYTLSAEVIDSRGAHSNRSREFPLSVNHALGAYAFYAVGLLLIAVFVLAGLFWRERSMRGIRADIGKEEDELLTLAHQMRQKLRTLESRERMRRRTADQVLAQTEQELAKELGEIGRSRKKRKPGTANPE